MDVFVFYNYIRCVHILCMCALPAEGRRCCHNSLEPELLLIVYCHAGARNQAQVLWNSSQCSYFLSSWIIIHTGMDLIKVNEGDPQIIHISNKSWYFGLFDYDILVTHCGFYYDIFIHVNFCPICGSPVSSLARWSPCPS